MEDAAYLIKDAPEDEPCFIGFVVFRKSELSCLREHVIYTYNDRTTFISYVLIQAFLFAYRCLVYEYRHSC
jgi:hypothetical protein